MSEHLLSIVASPPFFLFLLLSTRSQTGTGSSGNGAVKQPKMMWDVSSSWQQTPAVYIYIYKYIYLTTYLSSANFDNVNSREEQPAWWMEGAEKTTLERERPCIVFPTVV